MKWDLIVVCPIEYVAMLLQLIRLGHQIRLQKAHLFVIWELVVVRPIEYRYVAMLLQSA